MYEDHILPALLVGAARRFRLSSQKRTIGLVSKYLTLMLPCSDGSFFVAATPVGVGGPFPYASLPSLAALREFLERKIGFAPSVVEDFMFEAEIGRGHGIVARLRYPALEAIRENHRCRRLGCIRNES